MFAPLTSAQVDAPCGCRPRVSHGSLKQEGVDERIH